MEPKQLPVVEARDGDASAWDALFKRYQLPLYTYVFELIRDEQMSLDIVQETFINAVKHVGSLRENGKFGSWLFGIAHQRVIQFWRKRRLETMPLENAAEIEQGGDGPDTFLIGKEDEEQFMKLLEQLSGPHRAVLLLHFVEDFSLDEIAAITEVGVGTVKSRLHYAKGALRKLISGGE